MSSKAINILHKIWIISSLSGVRDFWFGFDGIYAFTIVMGIFVLPMFRARNRSLVEMCLCNNVFCHQIISWFHTWTDGLSVVKYDLFWHHLIINIHLKARNILHEIWSVSSLSGVPDLWDRNKILTGGDLSHLHVPDSIRVFFYFVWFVFIHHNFQFYFELCTYCNILDIYLS